MHITSGLPRLGGLLNRRLLPKRTVIALLALLECTAFSNPAFAQQATWTGATNSFWSEATNWTGTPPASSGTRSLTFAGTTGLANLNDLGGLTAGEIVFAGNAGSYTLSGSAITLSGSIVNQSTAVQTIGFDIDTGASVAGNLVRRVTGTVGSEVKLTGNISGIAGLTLSRLGTSGSFTLTLSGSNSFSDPVTFGANLRINVNSNFALGASGTLTAGNDGSIGNTSGTSVVFKQSFVANNLRFVGPGNLETTGTVTLGSSSGLQLLAGSGTFTVGSLGQNASTLQSVLNNSTLVIRNAAQASVVNVGISGTGRSILANSQALGSGTFTKTNAGILEATQDLVGGNKLPVDFVYVATSGTQVFAGSASMGFKSFSSSSTGADLSIRNDLPFGKILAFDALTVPTATTQQRYLNFDGAGRTEIGAIVSGVVDQSRVLRKQGAGVLVLTASNSYTTATEAAGGVMLLQNEYSLPGGIGPSGGTSALTISGSGVIGLGAGDFTRPISPGTTPTGEQVRITGGGFAAYGADRFVNISSGTTLTWTTNLSGNNVAFILGAATATHTVDFRNPILFGASATANRTIQADDGGAAIDGKLSGALTGSGTFSKTGDGTLQLTAANTYSGPTLVMAGRLLVDGTNSGAGAVNVASSAVLGGSGRIAGATAVSGMLTPGTSGSIGVLRFGSTLTNAAGSSTLFDIGGDLRGTSYDGIDVVGSLTYGGSLVFGFTSMASGTFNLFDGFTSQLGSLDSVTASGAFGSLTLNPLGGGIYEYSQGGTMLTFAQSTGDLVVVSVPEPTAIALAGIGIVLASRIMRRRQPARPVGRIG